MVMKIEEEYIPENCITKKDAITILTKLQVRFGTASTDHVFEHYKKMIREAQYKSPESGK